MIFNILVIYMMISATIVLILFMQQREDEKVKFRISAIIFAPVIMIVMIPTLFYYISTRIKRFNIEDLKVHTLNIRGEKIKDVLFFKFYDGTMEVETFKLLSKKFNLYYRTNDKDDMGNSHFWKKYSPFESFSSFEKLETYLISTNATEKFNL